MHRFPAALGATLIAACLSACTPPLSEETANEFSTLSASAASVVGAPAAIQTSVGREAAEYRDLCRYLAAGQFDLGNRSKPVPASALAKEQAKAGTALKSYVEALVEASRGGSIQALEAAQAGFVEEFQSFSGALGGERTAGIAGPAFALIESAGESRRQRRILGIMESALDPLFTLENLLERDASQVTRETERVVASWDREANCVVRASRGKSNARETFEELTERREEIARELAVIKNAPSAVKGLRVAHLTALRTPESFEASIQTFVATLEQLDALNSAIQE